MIIVAGHLRVASTDRDTVLARSREAIRQARDTPGCHDFAVSADPIDPGRINVYERWADRSALDAFRGSGPDAELGGLIDTAEIVEFEARATQPGQ